MTYDAVSIWTTFIQPCLAPAAAAIVAWRFGTIQSSIARQQAATAAAAAETARNKLKLELFKYRMDIFEAIERYILTVSTRPPNSDATPFFQEIRALPWLFEDDVRQWMHDEFMPKIAALQAARLAMRQGDVVSITAVTAAQTALLPQLNRLAELFAPYLKLRH